MIWMINGFTRFRHRAYPVLAGHGLMLRLPEMSDFPSWSALRAQSRAHLEPWEPVWPEDDLTRSAFRRRLQRLHEEADEEQTFSFLIFRAADSALMGGITLTNIRRRAAQTGTLGYWMGQEFAGAGHMGRAVRLVSDFAFRNLQLERLEAACLPENAASIRVLGKTGFQREGYARAYLSIAGRRRDHLLFGLVRTDLFPSESALP